MIICSAVPVYEEAPVSYTVLKENAEKIGEALLLSPEEERYLILPKGCQNMKFPGEIKVIEARDRAGFTYGNHSALKRVVAGEKSAPVCINGQPDNGERIVTAEELLEPEKKWVYIGGKAENGGTYCLKKNITPKEILDSCGEKGSFKAMYFGHPMGLFVGEKELEEPIVLTTDYIEVMNETDCILDSLLKIISRYEKESCGRCVFGHEGVTQLRMLLTDISLKKGKQTDIALMLDLCGEMKEQSLCEIGVSAANGVESALLHFKDEIEAHATKKSCQAGVCKSFLTFHILPDLCTGCNECVDECEDGAILGKKKFIHVIDLDECTQCGKCLEVCEEEAIVRAGAIKPRCPKNPIPCKR